MGKLRLRRIEKPDIDPVFDCGNASINAKLKETSCYMDVLQYAYLYEIRIDDRLVGYYRLSFRIIDLDLLPEDLSEYYAEEPPVCTAIHLDFIAIASQWQEQKVGTYALKLVMDGIKDRLCSEWPVRLFTLEALQDKISWYQHLGFRLCRKEDAANIGKPTVLMFWDCLYDPQRLETYLDSWQ